MVTSSDAQKKYGIAGTKAAESWMILWDVPSQLEIGVIPKKIYCNKDLVKPLEQAFTNLINRGYVNELKTWDGCYNIRKQRGSIITMSLHSWGIAIDLNAAWNGLWQNPTLSDGFVKCFTDAGFDWGGTWKRKDGMHFQLSNI